MEFSLVQKGDGKLKEQVKAMLNVEKQMRQLSDLLSLKHKLFFSEAIIENQLKFRVLVLVLQPRHYSGWDEDQIHIMGHSAGAKVAAFYGGIIDTNQDLIKEV